MVSIAPLALSILSDASTLAHTMNATGLIVALLTVAPFALAVWVERAERLSSNVVGGN